MSGHGAPRIDLGDAADLSVAVVASSWHTQVMDGLVAGAQGALAEAGIEPTLVRVPGSFELPVVAAELARTHDAVVALGVFLARSLGWAEALVAAVLEALDSGHLHAYVNDFPTEAGAIHPKVIALPHLGASTPEPMPCGCDSPLNAVHLLDH